MNIDGRTTVALRLMHHPRTVPDTARGDDLDWRQEGLCSQVDPELFYPVQYAGNTSMPAKRVCAGCPVKSECLAWAMNTHQEFGIWGGLSETDRRKLRKTWTGAA